MIVGALLARNEAAPDRYLRRALSNAASLCDKIVVLDDGSDDQTADICEEFGQVVRRPAGAGWWASGEEWRAREMLWQIASNVGASHIYIFDADHELLNITRNDLRLLTRSNKLAWCCPLYDCWESDEQMRVDGFWQAHMHPRPWLFAAKPYDVWRPVWSERGIHAGHFPLNHSTPAEWGMMPPGVAIRHLGYVKRSHRERKYERYLAAAAGVS